MMNLPVVNTVEDQWIMVEQNRPCMVYSTKQNAMPPSIRSKFQSGIIYPTDPILLGRLYMSKPRKAAPHDYRLDTVRWNDSFYSWGKTSVQTDAFALDPEGAFRDTEVLRYNDRRRGSKLQIGDVWGVFMYEYCTRKGSHSRHMFIGNHRITRKAQVNGLTVFFLARA